MKNRMKKKRADEKEKRAKPLTLGQPHSRTGMDAVRVRAGNVAVHVWKDIRQLGGQSGSQSSRRAGTQTRSHAATA